MTAGVFPQTSAGGLPATSANVNNAYIPGDDFNVSCVQTGLPSDCTARILPSQINAIVSELVALAEALTPEGTWSCASLTNLATAFGAWQNGTGDGTLQDAIFNALQLTDCDGVDIGAGAQLATCANVAAQIAAAIAALPADVFLQSVASYDDTSNVLTLNMSDGSTVPVDMTALVNDAVATALTPANVAGALGPAGGDLTGTYPNPSVDWAGNAAAINAVVSHPPAPTSLPPSGPASGDLTGSYPNPTVDWIGNAADIAAALNYRNCGNAPLPAGSQVATCDIVGGATGRRQLPDHQASLPAGPFADLLVHVTTPLVITNPFADRPVSLMYISQVNALIVPDAAGQLHTVIRQLLVDGVIVIPVQAGYNTLEVLNSQADVLTPLLEHAAVIPAGGSISITSETYMSNSTGAANAYPAFLETITETWVLV